MKMINMWRRIKIKSWNIILKLLHTFLDLPKLSSKSLCKAYFRSKKKSVYPQRLEERMEPLGFFNKEFVLGLDNW